MAKQLLLNRGFENELTNFNIQGAVSTNIDMAHSGIKSAQLLAAPTEIAELSQLVFFMIPGTPLKFSFRARKFRNEDVKCVSDVMAEISFLNQSGTVVPPNVVISIRGRDLSKKRWNYYEEYGEVPFGAVVAQVVIRLESPQSGKSGLLVDDLALVAEVAPPSPIPTAIPPNPVQPGNPVFPGPLANIPPQYPGQESVSQGYSPPVREITLGPDKKDK